MKVKTHLRLAATFFFLFAASLKASEISYAVGDTIDLLCDYYSYEGEYLDSYMLGEPLIIGEGELVIANATLPTDAHLLFTYRFTDLYQQHYWTLPIEG